MEFTILSSTDTCTMYVLQGLVVVMTFCLQSEGLTFGACCWSWHLLWCNHVQETLQTLIMLAGYQFM